MPYITIKNCITFAPNIGVHVHREALQLSPEELYELIRVAHSHMNDGSLLDACCGGRGPLTSYFEITLEDYLVLLTCFEEAKATAAAKKLLTKVRRTEFSAVQAQISLAMIEAGVQYVCAAKGCGNTQQLGIDHVIPLSRGGSDELSNLQFLCRSHNSKKSDTMPCLLEIKDEREAPMG